MNTVSYYIKRYASRLFKVIRDHGFGAFCIAVSGTVVASGVTFIAGHWYNSKPHIDISESIYAGSKVNVEGSKEYSALLATLVTEGRKPA